MRALPSARFPLRVVPAVLLATAVTAATLAIAGAQADSTNQAVEPTTLDEGTLVRAFTEAGLQVNPGYAMVYRDACRDYTYPALESCFGNNPVAPYVIPAVEAWPDESIGPTPVNAFGALRRGHIAAYRLAQRDAVVIYGRMPPPGKYMSVGTYLWTQHGRWKAKDYDKWAATPTHPPMRYVFSTMPPGDPTAGRIWSFSTLGDSVNDEVMRRESGDPFGQERYFIITPSAGTDRAVRTVLHAQGVPDGAIFTERIPRRDEAGPIGPLGMSENAVEFLTFFRYALPHDPEAGAQWWASVEGDDPPLRVMRVRAAPWLGPVERYDLLTYDERTARSEGYLSDDFQALVDGVCDTMGAGFDSADCAHPAPFSSFMAAPLQDFGWAGPYCRKIGMWCGDQTDAGLFYTGPLALDTGQVHAVVTTLATETGNATYVGLSINAASTYLAPSGLVDAQLKGSASGYSDAVNDPGKFFVHYFARDCSAVVPLLPVGRSADCTEIDDDAVPKPGDPQAIGDPTLFGLYWLGIRDYIAPGTQRGPDTSKLLRPRVLTFTPR